MAHLVLTDASVVWNAVDLSDHVTSVSLDFSVDEQPDSNMGDTWNARMAGLKDVSGTIEFDQDFAAGEVDATLWASIGTTVTVTIKPTSAAVSATNPSYSGSAFFTSYSPVSGAHGEKARTSVPFVGSGTWTRATS